MVKALTLPPESPRPRGCLDPNVGAEDVLEGEAVSHATATLDKDARSHAIVVGAGPAGLAVGACLKQADVPCVILKQSDRVGGTWHRHYERLHLHTPKAYSGLDPGAKTPVHEHPAGVVTFLTDAQMRVSPVGGKPNETPRKAKDVVAIEATQHTVENLGSARVELIHVELKAAP